MWEPGETFSVMYNKSKGTEGAAFYQNKENIHFIELYRVLQKKSRECDRSVLISNA